MGDYSVSTINALGEINTALGSATSNIIDSLGQSIGNVIVAVGDLAVDILGAIGNIITAIGNAVSNIIVALGEGISDIIRALGEGISNVILAVSEVPGMIIDLLGELLKNFFVPEDDYFSGKVDTLKTDLNTKIPYQSYQNNLQDVANAPGNTQNSITSTVDMNNLKFFDKVSISMTNFVDFSIFSKYRDIWFVWVRVFIYILLAIYWINEISKFFRGFSIAGYSTSHINQNNNVGGNEK